MISQRRSSVGGSGLCVPSTISELCSGIPRIQGYNNGMEVNGRGSSVQGNNHSTIQLDGVHDNNSLHFVSFFSVSEELLMKRNILDGGRAS